MFDPAATNFWIENVMLNLRRTSLGTVTPNDFSQAGRLRFLALDPLESLPQMGYRRSRGIHTQTDVAGT